MFYCMPVARVVNYVSQLRNKKGVSPADAGKTPNWLSLVFEVEAVPFLIHRHEAISGLTYAVTELSF